MKLKIVKDTFSNKDNTKTFFVVRYVIIDESDNIVRKGEPVIWLTKEQFELIKL